MTGTIKEPPPLSTDLHAVIHGRRRSSLGQQGTLTPPEMPRQAFVGSHGPVRGRCLYLGRSWEEARFGRHGPRVRLVTRWSAGPGLTREGHGQL